MATSHALCAVCTLNSPFGQLCVPNAIGCEFADSGTLSMLRS